MTRTSQIPALFLFETGAGVNLTSQSIVVPSWQSRIKRVNVSFLQKANKKLLELKRVVLLHVHIKDLKVRNWSEFIIDLTADIRVENVFIDCYVRGIFPSTLCITLRKSRPVCISAMGHESKKATKYLPTTSVLWHIARAGRKKAQRNKRWHSQDRNPSYLGPQFRPLTYLAEHLAWEREQVFVAGEVASTVPLVPFYVWSWASHRKQFIYHNGWGLHASHDTQRYGSTLGNRRNRQKTSMK